MSLREIHLINFRAFEDSDPIRVPSKLALVGQNDVGKSAVLHALNWFFNPPKKGLPISEVHGQDAGREVIIELAFDPDSLASSTLLIDAKNPVDLRSENLLSADGLLRLRLRLSVAGKESLEIKIHDLEDPKLFGLALTAKEPQLLELLTERGLDAVRSGNETNAEKRGALRELASQSGTSKKEDWIPLGDREKAVRDVLPTFAFFTDEARYGIAETAVQTTFKEIIDTYMQGNPAAEQVKADANTTLQEEIDKVFGFLSRLTSQVKGIKAVADVDWKKAVSGITVMWEDAFGTDVPYALRGAGVRRMFMVAYFQYKAAEGIHNPSGLKYVFCIEEPEVHLHPGAQRELMEAIQELGDLGHAVVFTTHSPVFAALVSADELALVTRSSMSANVEQSPSLDLTRVAHELGVEASDRLIGRDYAVLVEGKSDEIFLSQALELLFTAGKTGLDPSKVLFMQCGGVHNLRYAASTEAMTKAGLKWAVIVDSDRLAAGDPVPDANLATMMASPPASCCCFNVLERTTLENYYDPAVVRQVTGLAVDVPAFGKLSDLATGKPLPKRTVARKIKTETAAHDICAAMGAGGLLACSMTPGTAFDTQSEFVEMFERLRQCFGD